MWNGPDGHHPQHPQAVQGICSDGLRGTPNADAIKGGRRGVICALRPEAPMCDRLLGVTSFLKVTDTVAKVHDLTLEAELLHGEKDVI